MQFGSLVMLVPFALVATCCTSAEKPPVVDRNAALIRLAQSDRVALGRIEFADQNAVQRVFTPIWELEAQVNKGGFHQYFFNSSGETADGVLPALEAIGATRTRRIVADAIARFPGGLPPPDTEERRRRLEDVDGEKWDDLDAAFLQVPG